MKKAAARRSFFQRVVVTADPNGGDPLMLSASDAIDELHFQELADAEVAMDGIVPDFAAADIEAEAAAADRNEDSKEKVHVHPPRTRLAWWTDSCYNVLRDTVPVPQLHAWSPAMTLADVQSGEPALRAAIVEAIEAIQVLHSLVHGVAI